MSGGDDGDKRQALRSKGITDRAATTRYLITSAVIAAIGLALVYGSLFYLGATSSSVAAGANNGLSLINISGPTRLGMRSYAAFCLKKKRNTWVEVLM